MKSITESIYDSMKRDGINESIAPAEIKMGINLLGKIKGMTLQELYALCSDLAFDDFDEAYEEDLSDSNIAKELTKDELHVLWNIINEFELTPWIDRDGEANFNDVAPGRIRLRKYVSDKSDDSILDKDNAEWALSEFNDAWVFVGDGGENVMIGIPKRGNMMLKKFVDALGEAIMRGM